MYGEVEVEKKPWVIVPGVATSVVNIVTGVIKQMIVAGLSPNSAKLYMIQAMLIATVPIKTQVLNLMISNKIKAGQSEQVGPLYHANQILSAMLALANYPMIMAAPQVLNALSLNLSQEDSNTLSTGMRWNYANVLLNAYLANVYTFFFQTKRVDSTAVVSITTQCVNLLLTYLLTQYTDLGLEGVMMADVLGAFIGVLVAITIQSSKGFNRYRLFEISVDHLVTWKHCMSDSLKIGGFTLFAEVISNIATSFASLRYSSIPLKGALSVIQNATGVIAGLAGQIASPYVAENKNAEARRVIIKRQFLWGGIVPGLCAAGISLGIPRTLSTMLGGEGTANLSDSELYSNISLIFSISLLGNLLDLLYQTLIDRGHTRTPGVISSIGFTCIIPLCFVFENLLAETDYEDAVGNFAILASILFTLIGLGCYYKRLPEGEPTREERRPEYALLLMDHDAAAAAVDVRSVVEEAELA